MHDDQPLAHHTVTLLGDGPVEPDDLRRAYQLAPRLVAADGGARHAHDLGLPVSEIVGDLDSITHKEVWHKLGTRLTHLTEQDTTDFEKCLYHVVADFYLGVGFLGRRLDHSLACLRTMAIYAEKRIVLVGETDVVVHCPPTFRVEVEPGTRVSFFPMGDVQAKTSSGLKWPLDGLRFAPNGMIGTSNEAVAATVTAEFEGPGMLALLPKDNLDAAIRALGG